MKNGKKLSIILVSLFILSSCNFPQLKTPVERCVTRIKKIENANLYRGYCRCHPYEISRDYVGRAGDSYNKPLEYCDNQVGFPPVKNGWPRVRAWMDLIFDWLDEYHPRNKGRTK
jgi:hypothetical protein